MKFFLDTADLAEIEEAASWGALAGVTTNPSLYAKIGGKLDDFHNHMKRICDIVGPDCPVSAESVAMTRDEIVADGRKLAEIAPNIVVKIPTMVEGLAATHTLAAEGIPVNMTLCFSVPQALLAARAGARYISPFIGRFDDISEDGLEQVGNIVTAINNYDFTANTANGEQVEITDVKYDFDPETITPGVYDVTFSTEGYEYKVSTTHAFEEGEQVGLVFRPEDIHVMKKEGQW